MNELLPNIADQVNTILQSLIFFIPETGLAILFLLLIITDLIYGGRSRWVCWALCLMGLGFVAFWDYQQFFFIASGPHLLFGNMVLLHHVSILFKLIFAALAFVIILFIPLDNALKYHRKGLGDLYAIIIAIVFGLHLMAMSVNLLMVYLSVETVSIGSYILAAYLGESKKASESALKYVIFGTAASAVMLYGISLLYVFTGTLDIFGGHFIEHLTQVNPLAVSLALLMVMAGMGFKLSFVPMHFWVPDVYEGTATPLVAFLSTLTKIAGFALLTNFLTPFIFFAHWSAFDFRLFFSVVGIATMIVGNFAAIQQNNLKRMLAYSAIGHTGFALMAFVTFTQQGISALLFYLVVYAVANIGAFVLCSFFAGERGADTVQDLQGLGKKHPFASVCFVIFLISLTGLPITAGFNGKVLVFSSALETFRQTQNSWLLALMITGAVTTVVSLFYYFKIPLYLFLKSKDHSEVPISSNARRLLVLCGFLCFLTLLFGIFPDMLTGLLR